MSANSITWMCAWVAAELIGLGSGTTFCQVRGRASSPRLMRKGRVNFPKCVCGGQLTWAVGDPGICIPGTSMQTLTAVEFSQIFFLILNKFLLKCHFLRALTRGRSIMSAKFLKECRRNFLCLQQKEVKRNHSEVLSVHPNTQFLMSVFRRSY